MPHRSREPRVLAAAPALALAVLLAACGRDARPGADGTGPPSAPATSASATVTPSPVASPSATAPPTAAGPVTVIGVLGDYGVDGPAVRQVVAAMGRFSPRPLDAVVTTGDNAYTRGTAAQAAFARSALAPLLRRGTPLYASLGNHDEATAGGAAVMRALGMKARWYTALVGTVQLVVLDANRTGDAAQLAFLRRVLAAPRPVAFRVVVFHQPAVSCSFHGPDPGVVRSWVPLFRNRVDLVLAGHNHTYERFRGEGGVTYVTTGGGGADLYPSLPTLCKGPGRIVLMRTVHHAVRLRATADRLTVEAIGVDGRAFDSVALARR
ncbi:MAG TPA: metallophosphoesterase [Mycobacteriales bacterium]|jgi:hypothetical protein|nr:metallophosphoesterase [Mycobacteriales bacterium]